MAQSANPVANLSALLGGDPGNLEAGQLPYVMTPTGPVARGNSGAFSGPADPAKDVPGAGYNPVAPAVANPAAAATPPPAAATTPAASKVKYGGGWGGATGQAAMLKAAFDKGLTGEAAVQAAGVGAYYPGSGQYGLEGSYISPESDGALSLIQRVAEGTPGRQYGGMQGSGYNTGYTPVAPSATPATVPTIDPTTGLPAGTVSSTSGNPATQGYSDAINALIAKLAPGAA